jgi:protein arginine phosphatase
VSHPIVFLCTGNAARSVMGGAALAAHLPDWHVTTAGTLVVEGQPMSWRTKAALESVGLSAPSHRSRQATDAELRHAALVIALAPEHVQWVRRTHPEAARRTATLRRLARDLPAHDAPLPERIASLDLADVELGEWEEVVDPGGGDAEEFAACAAEVVDLVAALAPRLVGR